MDNQLIPINDKQMTPLGYEYVEQVSATPSEKI